MAVSTEEAANGQDDYHTSGNIDESSSSDERSSSITTNRFRASQRSVSPRESSNLSSTIESSLFGQAASTFTLPNRSIFMSGLPTSSISVNTAHASMSSPQSASNLHPLSTLSTSNATSARRTARETHGTAIQSSARSTPAQKHTDDPSAPMENHNFSREHGRRSTSLAVSNLFAATDYTNSRATSFGQPSTTSSHTGILQSSSIALPSHLYVRGLIDGRHSDITVHCFGSSYALHKLLLDRAPFFCSALSEPWFESTAKEITLHPEEMDPNITQASFELALKRIYGCADREEEEKHPTSLFATGCWLEMPDLIDASIASILNQMAPSNLADCIKFVTSNYYGKYGTQILTAAKAMLYREGYEMLLKHFDGISGELIKEILSSDAFYVPGEWERWTLAEQIFNRRVKAKARSLSLIGKTVHLKLPRPQMSPIAFRDQLKYECYSETTSDSNVWIQLYTDPDIACLFDLLENGIYYIHMTFEQLQQIKVELDVLKVIPLVPQAVISNALWQSMLLRQRVINAEESEIELGLAESPSEQSSPSLEKSLDQESLPQLPTTEGDENDTSTPYNTSLQSQRYWIPSIDSTYQLGVADDLPELTTPYIKTARTQYSDATEFAGVALPPEDTAEAVSPKITNRPGANSIYSKFPPFRFSVEFQPVKTWEKNVRVKSNTIWYAGSIWYIYSQEKTTSEGVELGIYLHREKYTDTIDVVVRGATHNTTADQRIGLTERELYRRQRGRRRFDNALHRPSGELSDFYSDLLRARIVPDLDTVSGLVRPRSSVFKSSEGSLAQDLSLNTAGAFNENGEETSGQRVVPKKPTLPPYVDSRPTIKTYFKIYIPSRGGGRTMSVYESAPDQFNFHQSWGWTSPNLVVDDNLDKKDTTKKSKSEARVESLNASKLRFMVVIGIV